MFNPIILIAIVAQSLITKASRMAGAIMGFIITTGILLWGLSLYGADSGVVFFGIPLTAPVFVVLCLVWYGFDTRAFLRARTAAKRSAPPAKPVTAPQAAAAPAEYTYTYTYAGTPEGSDPGGTNPPRN